MAAATLIDGALTVDASTSDDPTTERIVDAALAELQEFGLRRTSVDGVARRARLGRMTVYRRFPGKNALVNEVIARELGRLLTELERTISARATVSERLTEGMVRGIISARKHPLLRRLIETDAEAVLPYLTIDAEPFLTATIAFVAARVREASDAHIYDPASIDKATEAAVRLGQSLLLTPPAADASDDRVLRELARTVIPAAMSTARQ